MKSLDSRTAAGAVGRLIFNALASFIPTRDEAIAMYVARWITPANIEATGELADKAVDKLIEKILKASKAVKE